MRVLFQLRTEGEIGFNLSKVGECLVGRGKILFRVLVVVVAKMGKRMVCLEN